MAVSKLRSVPAALAFVVITKLGTKHSRGDITKDDLVTAQPPRPVRARVTNGSQPPFHFRLCGRGGLRSAVGCGGVDPKSPFRNEERYYCAVGFGARHGWHFLGAAPHRLQSSLCSRLLRRR